MLNPHAQWRIEFAQHLARRIAAFEGVRAIVVAGSVGRGYADEYSDIEIPVFWETLPDDATRGAIASALNARFLYAYNGPAHEDQLLIDGVQVDLWDISTARQEEILEAVVEKYQFDPGMLNALDTIRSCVPLFGHEIVQKWKLRAQAYPDELAKRVIRAHLAAFSMGELFILARRNNPTAFYSQLSFLQQEVFNVLLALNRRYFPTFKWIYPALEAMQIKPEAAARRFRQAYEVPYEEAAADTKLILEETIGLIEKQFPGMDTGMARQRLLYLREAQKIRTTAPASGKAVE